MSATLRKDHGVLAGLLALQLVLAGITWTSADRAPTDDAGKSPVFSTAADEIVRIEIVAPPPSPDSDASSLEFERNGDDWVLASVGGYPARSDKVEELIKTLAGLRVGEPIASNASSHESLRVGQRQYDRRVTVAGASDSESVVLGAGQRSSINVRREGENDVRVARGTPPQSIRADARNYVALEYVAVEKDDLTRIEVTNAHGRLVFDKREGGWTVRDFPDGVELDEAALATFINNVARMTLQAPVGKQVDPSYGIENGARVVLVGTGENETVYADYVIGDAADERSYYAKTDGSEFVVTVPKWGAEQIRDKKVDDFVKKPEA